jgi:hypothetical protein
MMMKSLLGVVVEIEGRELLLLLVVELDHAGLLLRQRPKIIM